MLLRRVGNKKKIAKDIIKYFPTHNVYIEPFFGAGGMFFNKPKAKHNILNDIDNEVINLFKVVREKPDKLRDAFEVTPYHEGVFKEWRFKEEEDEVWRAVRFIYLSNYSYLGMNRVLRIDTSNHKKQTVENLNKTIEFLSDCSLVFTNSDFRRAIKQISLRPADVPFVYADPPYVGTEDNYSNSFKEQDFIDLLDILQETKYKFAVSEFDNDFVLKQAKDRGLNVYTICERRTLNNRNTEILITNYKNHPTLF